MTCDDIRPRLTAYLDGELEGDRGSAIRGHLRGCAACRQAANDEAALRDGLRALPPLEPPASLWAGVQRQLAEAEVADARTPAWRRAVVRFWRGIPLTPRFGLTAVALAGAIGVLAWRYAGHHETAQAPVVATHDRDPVVVPPAPPAPAPAPLAPVTADGDVAAEVAAQPARDTASYAADADDHLKLALEQRSGWSDDRKQVFDAKLTELRHAVDVAREGRPRQKAYRALIRYLQRVTTRDDVAFADVRVP